MMSLQDKVALVTGGASGIGAALVQDLLKEGAKFVAIVDINEAVGKVLEAKLIAEYGNGKVEFMECDVTKDDQLFEVFDKITQKHDYIDIVVNNAGISNESLQMYKTEIEINYTAVVTGTLKALEMMREDRNGRGGTVINVSSISALAIKSPTIFIYAGTKAAVLLFSCCIGKAEYYSKTKVRVLTMCFGSTESSISNTLNSFDEVLNMDKMNLIQLYPMQSAKSASRSVIEAYKKGESGSVWLSERDKPAVDITDRVNKAYGILSENIFDS